MSERQSESRATQQRQRIKDAIVFAPHVDRADARRLLVELETAEAEVQRLQAENASLRERLKPFAAYAEEIGANEDEMGIADRHPFEIDFDYVARPGHFTVGDVRRAAEALQGDQP